MSYQYVSFQQMGEVIQQKRDKLYKLGIFKYVEIPGVGWLFFIAPWKSKVDTYRYFVVRMWQKQTYLWTERSTLFTSLQLLFKNNNNNNNNNNNENNNNNNNNKNNNNNNNKNNNNNNNNNNK